MRTTLQRLMEKIYFYSWAYGRLGEGDSDIGPIGEFLVGRQIGGLDASRKVQAAFDLVLSNGVTVEVKTTSRMKSDGRGKMSYRWDISDQKLALAGKKPIADYWVFLIARFPDGAADDLRFDPFDERYWICYVLSGEQLRATGNRSYISESVVKKLADIPCAVRELKAKVGGCDAKYYR